MRIESDVVDVANESGSTVFEFSPISFQRYLFKAGKLVFSFFPCKIFWPRATPILRVHFMKSLAESTVGLSRCQFFHLHTC